MTICDSLSLLSVINNASVGFGVLKLLSLYLVKKLNRIGKKYFVYSENNCLFCALF